jgi:acyl transferase domain-containing protein
MKAAVKKLVEQGITDPAVIACTLQIKRTRVETALAWIARDADRTKQNATKKSTRLQRKICWSTMPLVVREERGHAVD